MRGTIQSWQAVTSTLLIYIGYTAWRISTLLPKMVTEGDFKYSNQVYLVSNHFRASLWRASVEFFLIILITALIYLIATSYAGRRVANPEGI